MTLESQKLVSFTKSVSNLSDRPSINASELKEMFDAAPNELREKYNSLIDSLMRTTAGDSGAKNLGASTIPGLTGNDAQSLLESLKSYVDTKSTGALYGIGSQSFNSGFLVMPSYSWVKEANGDVFTNNANNTITFKKSGLYAVDLSCTRSDLAANQWWEIGFSINNDAGKMQTEKMIMGQYGWEQSGSANLSQVPLKLSTMVRVNANDYINFNNNSQDGPRSYNIKFRVIRISD